MDLIEFLRLWCEGHNIVMQDLMREQEDNKKPVNLVEFVVSLSQTIASDAGVLRGMEEPELLELLGQLEFIAEVIQGPCTGNQIFLATGTELCEVLKRTLISKIHKPGQNTTITVARVRAASCKIFAALLEGSDHIDVMEAISGVLDEQVFRQLIREIFKLCRELEMIKGEEAQAEFAYLLSAGYDIMSTYMQLQENFPELKKGILPTPEELSEKGGYYEGFQWIKSKVVRLEFFWRDTIDITYFAIVKEAKGLTKESCDRVVQTVKFDSPDGKKREFMELAQALVDEMNHLYMLSGIGPLNFIKVNYFYLRNAAWLFSILLNVLLLISIRGPGNVGGSTDYLTQDQEQVYVYERPQHVTPMDNNNSLVDVEDVVYIFTFVVIVMYALCLVYTIASRAPLVIRKRNRETKTQLAVHRRETQDPKAKLPWGEWPLLVMYFMGIAFYGVLGGIFYLKWGNTVFMTTKYVEDGSNETYFNFLGSQYVTLGVLFFGAWLLPLLNDFWDGSDHFVAKCYVSLFRTLTEQETFALIVFQTFIVLGIRRFYFTTLVLMDFVTLSARLQNVAKAVIHPIKDLVLVFTLMIFVAFIFASFGLFFFGGYYVYTADDNVAWSASYGEEVNPVKTWVGDDGMENGTWVTNPFAGAANFTFRVQPNEPIMTCPNLAMCFFEVRAILSQCWMPFFRVA